jgi:hypothetical protein
MYHIPAKRYLGRASAQGTLFYAGANGNNEMRYNYRSTMLWRAVEAIVIGEEMAKGRPSVGSVVESYGGVWEVITTPRVAYRFAATAEHRREVAKEK